MEGVATSGDVRFDRFDSGPIKFERLPYGGFRTAVRVARLGVYVYRQPDGSEFRELVDEQTLSDADWLKSCKGVPVTNDHPPESVTADNMREYRIGVALDEGKFEAPYHVQNELQVDDATGLDAIEDGRVQISPGYRCDSVGPGGTHPIYGRYDAVQRNRRCNHIAICDAARGGPDVRILRLDHLPPIEPVVVQSDSSEQVMKGLSDAMKDMCSKVGLDAALFEDDMCAKDAIFKKMDDDAKVKEEKDAAYSAEVSGKIAALEEKVKEAAAMKTAAEVALQRALEEHESSADKAISLMDEALDDPDGAKMDSKLDSAKAASIRSDRRKFLSAFVSRSDKHSKAVSRAVEAGISHEDAITLGYRDLSYRVICKSLPNVPSTLTTDAYEAMIDLINVHKPKSRTDSTDQEGNFWAKKAKEEVVSGTTKPPVVFI